MPTQTSPHTVHWPRVPVLLLSDCVTLLPTSSHFLWVVGLQVMPDKVGLGEGPLCTPHCPWGLVPSGELGPLCPFSWVSSWG